MCRPGVGLALGTEIVRHCLSSLSTTFSLLLKRKTRFLSEAKLTDRFRVAGPSHPVYEVLKLPYVVNLYSGFVVWLCEDVKLYLPLIIVGGGAPAAV